MIEIPDGMTDEEFAEREAKTDEYAEVIAKKGFAQKLSQKDRNHEATRNNTK